MRKDAVRLSLLSLIVGAVCVGGAAGACTFPALAAQTVAGGAASGRGDATKLAFAAGAKEGDLCFNTGLLHGSLCGKAAIELSGPRKASGLQDIVYIPTKTPVSKLDGWFAYNRVLDADLRYAKPWQYLPCSVKLLPDGAGELRWEATEERPWEMRGIYRLSAPDTIDLTTVVRAQKDLRRVEVAVSAYFEGFSQCFLYLKPAAGVGGTAGFREATQALGELMLSPRDEQALAIVKDGRWRGKAPNQLRGTILPCFAGAMAVRRDEKTGLTAITMAPPRDCFAVKTYYGEQSHRAIYLSLSGCDLKAGQTDHVRCRLVLGPNISNEDALGRYEAYVRSLDLSQPD